MSDEAQRAIADCLTSLDTCFDELNRLQRTLTGLYEIVNRKGQGAAPMDVAQALTVLTAWVTQQLPAAAKAATRSARGDKLEGLEGLTIKQFCARNYIVKSSYFQMKRQGRGPAETRYGVHIRISLEAEAQWKAQRMARAARRAGFVPTGVELEATELEPFNGGHRSGHKPPPVPGPGELP